MEGEKHRHCISIFPTNANSQCTGECFASYGIREYHSQETAAAKSSRAFGKGCQEFYDRAKEEFGIKFIKGRPAKIEEDSASKNLILWYEDTEAGTMNKADAEMVVLAVGSKMLPVDSIMPLPVDEDRFVRLKDPSLDPVTTTVEGIFAAGLATGPKDIPDSVAQAGAAAMKASILVTR